VVTITPVKAHQAGDEFVAVGGHPWHLNGQPLGPEMGAFWSLMLLPMVLNVTLSGYGLLLTNVPGIVSS
jgi:hypothetical protein